MHIRPGVTFAALKEVRAASGFSEHTNLIVSMEFDEFIGFHIDVEQICIPSGQRPGYVSGNNTIFPSFLTLFFKLRILTQQILISLCLL